jgi:high frequency lysogenization protein
MNKRKNQTLALAGLMQAAHMVEELANKGELNRDDLETMVHSLFEQNPKTPADVYGPNASLKGGLQELRFLFSQNKKGSNANVLRYALNLLHLESCLRKHPDMLNNIGKGLDKAKVQAEHFHRTHENVMANLANIYHENLSTLRFRIQVKGQPVHLQNKLNANVVRTLLLAGIRSATLWRQLGGHRWHLIFTRKHILKEIDELLAL